jgi:hypothetical protein
MPIPQEKQLLRLQVHDASRQKRLTVDDVPPDATVGEVVQSLLAELGLPIEDAEGSPLSYQALLEREQRHIHATERVGDALLPDDSLTLHPNIQAG